MQPNRLEEGNPNFSWKATGTTFAAVMMVTIGVFEVINGLGAILSDQYFAVTDDYIFALDVSAWGWIHLILGGVVLAAGVALFMDKPWASAFGLFLAMLVAIVNFMYIPNYPFWSILVIALCVWVMWSLAKPTPTRM